MDALFLLKHSSSGDLEIRYALRAIERHMPWVRRVVVFGDRPAFLSEDPASGVLHVPHEAIAWVGPYRTPVTNMFVSFFLASLLPTLDEEFLFFCDDFILLDDFSEEEARRVRYLEDLDLVQNRGRGLWKDALWRTYDTLKRRGYSGLNMEGHVPVYMKKSWVLDAFRDLKDFTSEDRFYGLLGPTAILNHARQAHQIRMVDLREEGTKIGFHGTPPTREEVLEKTVGKLFLNFDDAAFGSGLQRFLAERFPEACRYER